MWFQWIWNVFRDLQSVNLMMEMAEFVDGFLFIYRCDPQSMQLYIPGLLYTIRMIFATSRYYNNTKQISTLLVKVTNQILNMCMDYLTNGGKKTIWNQDKANFIKKARVRIIKYFKHFIMVYAYQYRFVVGVGKFFR